MFIHRYIDVQIKKYLNYKNKLYHVYFINCIVYSIFIFRVYHTKIKHYGERPMFRKK